MITLKVLDEYVGQRLDIFLYEKLYDYLKSHDHEGDVEFLSRSLIQDIIHQGVYKTCGENEDLVKQSSYNVKENEVFQIDLSEIEKALRVKKRRVTGNFEVIPEKGELDIVYEDDKVLVLNKRAGVVVHPGIKHLKDTLANYVKEYLVGKGEFDNRLKNSGVVHRLDKPVSGLIIFAKDLETQNFLKEQFKKRKVKKYYLARVKKLSSTRFNEDLVIGSWYKIKGSITRDVSSRMRRKFYKDDKFKEGRWSITNIYAISPEVFLINIVTGRNHQIRAVLRTLGYYIVGDDLYGRSEVENDVISLKSIMLKIPNMYTEVNQWLLEDTIGDDVEHIIIDHLESN